VNHTCGTCRFATGWTMTSHNPPRINPRFASECQWTVSEPKAWPISISERDRRLPSGSYVYAGMKNCPCWESFK
jgi:hypothetical protein